MYNMAHYDWQNIHFCFCDSEAFAQIFFKEYNIDFSTKKYGYPPTFENINVTFVSGLGRMYAEIAGATAGILSDRKYTTLLIMHIMYIHMIYIVNVNAICTLNVKH